MIFYSSNIYRKNKIFAAIIIILCVIIASVEPLQVSATEVEAPISDVAATVAGSLAGGIAGYAVSSWAAASLAGATAVVLGGVAIPVAIVVIVLGIVVGLGVSLVVTQIVHALNEYWANHQADFQIFIDKIVDGFKDGLINLRGKINFSPSMFTYCVDWVKENVIGFFNINTPNTDFSEAINGMEVYSTEYIYENGKPNVSGLSSYINDNSNVYDETTITQSEANGLESGEFLRFLLGTKTFTNSRTKAQCKFGGQFDFIRNGSSAYVKPTMTFYLSNDLKFSKSFQFTINDGRVFSNQNFTSFVLYYFPYCYKQNNKYKLDFFADWKVKDVSDGSTKIEQNTQSNIKYYVNNTEIQHDWYYKTIKSSDNSTSYYLSFPDGTEQKKFDDIYEFMYILMCKNCTLNVFSNNTVVESGQSTTITYTTVNNYYSDKRDILSKPANTIRAKETAGEIDDTSVGTISIGVTDVAGDLVSDGELADTIPVTDYLSISDVASTEISTSGTEVLEPNAILDVFTAMVIAANSIREGLGTVKYKFPFDVIPNVRNWLNNLIANGSAPVYDLEIVAPHIGTFPVHIDFGKYQVVSTVFRWIVRVSLAIGLLIASKYALQFI